MTRHTKKKEPDKKDSSYDPNLKESVPQGPDNSQIERPNKNPIGTLFWLRVGIGVLAGIVSAIVGNPMDSNSRVFLGFGIMIGFFIGSYFVAKVMHIQIPTSDRKKLVTTGIGSYFFIFIFSWIIVNTLMHPAVTGVPIK